MNRRGRPQKAIYVNPYRPATLVEFACRVAISSRYETLGAFARECDWTRRNISATLAALDRADVAAVESTVNAAGVELRPGWGYRKAFFLVGLYDSLVFPPPVPGHSLEGDPPSRYLFELANSGIARSKPEILDRGRALRTFMNELRSVDQLRQPAYRGAPPIDAQSGQSKGDVVRDVVRDLCVIAVQPTGLGGYEATRMVAETGVYALRAVRQMLLAGSPASWRLIRVVTTCLRSARHWDKYTDLDHPRNPAQVRREAIELLLEIDDRNPPNEYPARSLWEEAIGMCPLDLEPEVERSLRDRLRRRAIEGHTAWGAAGHDETVLPVRERTVAAWTYVTRVARAAGWEPEQLRSLGTLPEPVLSELREFAAKLKEASDDRGLEYAALFIENSLGDVFWPWPPEAGEPNLTRARQGFVNGSNPDNASLEPANDEFWHKTDEAKIVLEALRSELPHDLDGNVVRPGLYALCYAALLTIDGVIRRESLVTIDTAGLNAQAARVFRVVIERARSSNHRRFRWLIETAAFALGRMYDTASIHVLNNLAGDRYVDDSIRIAAFHALADMADSVREKDHIESGSNAAREVVDTALRALDTEPGDTEPHKFRARAALYLIGMYRIDDDDYLDRLRRLRDDDERFVGPGGLSTRALAQWAIDRVVLRRMAEECWNSSVHHRPSVDPDAVAHQQRSPASRLRRVADPYESLRVLDHDAVPEWTLDLGL